MTIFTNGPDTRRTFIESQIPSTASVMSNAFDDALSFSPTASLSRGGQLNRAQFGDIADISAQGLKDTGVPFSEPERIEPASEILTVEDQQARIKEASVNLKPEEGLRADTLQLLIDWKRDEVTRASVWERSTGKQAMLGFAAGVVGSMFDPLNVAASFVPVLGQARWGAAIARGATPLARGSMRATQGALAGAQGALLVEPIVLSQAMREQADYDSYNSLMNIAFGTFLGAGLHVGTGAIGDGIRRVQAKKSRAELEARAQIFSDDIALALGDRNPVGNFRVADLMRNPELASAGLLDGGRIGEAPRMHYDITTLKVPRGVPPEEMTTRSRAMDPDTFARMDDLSKELEDIRGQTPVEAQRTADGEAALDKYAELESKRNTKDKRILRRLDKQQAKVLDRLGELGFPTKIAQAKGAVTKSKNKGQKATKHTKELETELKQLRKKSEKAYNKVLKEIENERRFDTRNTVTGVNVDELAKFSNSTSNSRLANFEVLDDRIAQFADDASMELDGATAKAELDDAMLRLKELGVKMGDDGKALVDSANVALKSADDVIALAELHRTALGAALTCGGRV